MNRSRDWLAQAERDVAFAREICGRGYHEWACFAAQQAAEKAVKALALSRGGEPWGHALHLLLDELGRRLPVPPEILDAGRRLDKHYVPARYPNGFAEGHPANLYTEAEAKAAVHDAETIVAFCRDRLARP